MKHHLSYLLNVYYMQGIVLVAGYRGHPKRVYRKGSLMTPFKKGKQKRRLIKEQLKRRKIRKK